MERRAWAKPPRKHMGFVMVFAALGLIGWIVYLIENLPSSYHVKTWNVAWIGFDIGMVLTLLFTAWGIFSRRMIAIPGSLVTATLLLVDSWFDVITSHGTKEFKVALILALFFEIPSAVLLFAFSHRMIRGLTSIVEK